MSVQQLQQDVELDFNTETSQYLTFMLNSEEYGIEILKVQGIQGWCKVTPIPNTPDFILGVINLRGAVVPIVDLRKRFQLSEASYGSTTVIIVVKIGEGDGERTVGMVADAVSEVYNVAESELSPPPDLGSTIGTDYIKGLTTIDNKMVILLNVDELIGEGVMSLAPDQLVEMNSGLAVAAADSKQITQ